MHSNSNNNNNNNGSSYFGSTFLFVEYSNIHLAVFFFFLIFLCTSITHFLVFYLIVIHKVCILGFVGML